MRWAPDICLSKLYMNVDENIYRQGALTPWRGKEGVAVIDGVEFLCNSEVTIVI